MGAVIPLTDVSRRPTTFPAVSLLIILINVVVFLFELALGEPFVQKWAVVPAHITAGKDYITIITAMFMHASWSHIIGNMVFFWAFAPEIEDAMGHFKFAVFYLVGGIVAFGAQIAFDPHSTVPNLGASGAIAAVMGGFLVTYPRDEIRSILVIFVFAQITYISSALLIGAWFVMQLFSIGQIATAQSGGVAYLAHVGGFIFGAVTARLFEGNRAIEDS